jgi:hypothetical protein
MSKTKMQEARELIRAGRNNEARDILKTIDHPLAREWLQKLDKIAPDTRRQNVYVEAVEVESHPYEPEDNEESGWMRSVRDTQSNWDVYHEKRVAGAKVQSAKQRRKRFLDLILAILIFLIAMGMIFKVIFDAGEGNFRPVAYWFGFTFLLGLPLRVILRVGHDEDKHPGVIVGIIMTIIVLVAIVLVEYGLYLRELNIYDLTFSGDYFSSYIQIALGKLGLPEMLLFVYAWCGVASVVFPTDEEFSNSINSGLRSGARAGIRGLFR